MVNHQHAMQGPTIGTLFGTFSSDSKSTSYTRLYFPSCMPGPHRNHHAQTDNGSGLASSFYSCRNGRLEDRFSRLLTGGFARTSWCYIIYFSSDLKHTSFACSYWSLSHSACQVITPKLTTGLICLYFFMLECVVKWSILILLTGYNILTHCAPPKPFTEVALRRRISWARWCGGDERPHCHLLTRFGSSGSVTSWVREWGVWTHVSNTSL